MNINWAVYSPRCAVLEQLCTWFILSKLMTGTMCSTFFIWAEAQALSCGFFEVLMLWFPLPLSPHTVCYGHHRTEVHLTGHRLPGTLLTHNEPQRTEALLHILRVQDSLGPLHIQRGTVDVTLPWPQLTPYWCLHQNVVCKLETGKRSTVSVPSRSTAWTKALSADGPVEFILFSHQKTNISISRFILVCEWHKMIC